MCEQWKSYVLVMFDPRKHLYVITFWWVASFKVSGNTENWKFCDGLHIVNNFSKVLIMVSSFLSIYVLKGHCICRRSHEKDQGV